MRNKISRLLAVILTFSLACSMLYGCGSGRTSKELDKRNHDTVSESSKETGAEQEKEETQEAISSDKSSFLTDSFDEDTARKGLNRAEASGKASAYTILVYIVGADLESAYGMASTDMKEMLEASFGKEINLIIEAGGTTRWHNSIMDDDSVGRYKISDGNITRLSDIGLVDMTSSDTLADFLKWGVSEYPADRYAAILWDHGGGTLYGFGSDEHFSRSGTLMISDLKKAFDASGTYFDFIGFDACLMATAEVAYSLKSNANYLIASEEVEVDRGWYYTDWLTALGQDPYMPIETIGRNIIDGFVDEISDANYSKGDLNSEDSATLSMIDLGQLQNVVNEMKKYFDMSSQYLATNGKAGYSKLAKARVDCRNFGREDCDQIDILDYITSAALPGSFDLQKAVRDSIIYNNSNIKGSTGLAMYFPYYNVSSYSYAIKHMGSVGYKDDYFLFFNDFCSVQSYAQNENVDEEWFSEEAGANSYDGDSVSSSESLEFDYVNGDYLLQFSEEDWDIISSIEALVWLYGEGIIIELGKDRLYSINDDGALVGNAVTKWLYINGEVVPTELLEDGYLDSGEYYSVNVVPAKLDGEEIEIVVLYYEGSDGYELEIIGYMLADDGEEVLADRFYYEFEEDDEIIIYIVVYDEDFNELGNYEYDPIVYGRDGLSASYESLEDDDIYTIVYYHITDIYRNDYYTEAIIY